MLFQMVENPEVLLICVLEGFFLSFLFFVNLLCCTYLYYLSKKREERMEAFLKIVNTPRSFWSKIKLAHLSFFLLGPNLVLINNGLNVVLQLILFILIFFLGALHPFFFGLYFILMGYGFVSFFFGLSFEKSPKFQEKINRFYFKENKPEEVRAFLTFFFGNMFTRGGQIIGTGTSFLTSVGVARHLERQEALQNARSIVDAGCVGMNIRATEKTRLIAQEFTRQMDQMPTSLVFSGAARAGDNLLELIKSGF